MQQFFHYGVSGPDISFETSSFNTPVASEWMVGPAKLQFRSSPNSPLSTHFESDTCTALSTSPEQRSSSENNSGFSPSTSHFQDTVLLRFVGSSVLRDAESGPSIRVALQEIEATLMGPEAGEDEPTTTSSTFDGNILQELSTGSPGGSCQEAHQGPYSVQPQPSFAAENRRSSCGFHGEKRHKVTQVASQGIPQGDLKRLLIECARAFAESRMDDFENLIEQARGAVSICGEPIQRLGAYLIEGLIARMEESGPNIYRSLRCKEPESKDLLSYMQILYEVCPYLKFGYMAANGAIAEAFKNEDHVHIIDFQIAQGTQWMTLLQALSARPNGPPHVRITGIDDPVSKYARGDTLELVGKRLAAMSEKFKIPIEFQAVPVYALDITREMLDVRPGEALAVNFPLMLHHTPDESVDINNPRDGLLRMVKSLSPKVVTLVEQESNTNTTSFLKRFVETLEFYTAMFESIDGTMPRDKRERINVEQHCLARDIVNIIACEGKERVERHELLGKWKSRFSMAGFQAFPLSSHVNSVIGSLLRCYSDHYTLLEKDGAMLLGWKDRNLISASAWH
ncbi:hypothetical protein Sjap_003392 [Stephania japonica]|uniref:Uncharacterized protein n=1 Tax=Stephania japonica TaxID=461633 RepID=A0AAP0KQR9_9MAGN